MVKLIDLTGQRFGKLVVLKRAKKENYKDGHACWLCKCDCGNHTIVSGRSLRRGFTQSCGCLAKEIRKKATTKHSLAKTRLDNIYCSIKKRCLNPNELSYIWYGARGITMCDEWLNNKNSFFEWAYKNGYNDNLTIDRINVNGNYEPNNCKWSNAQEQARNRRTNFIIEYNNEKHTLIEWAEILGFKRATLAKRLKSGWSIEKTFNTPLMVNQYKFK